VAHVLADHWRALPLAVELAKQGSQLLELCLRHVDATDDDKERKKIKTQAKTECSRKMHTVLR